MNFNAGVTCFARQARNQDAGLISIVASRDGETEIGIATLTGQRDTAGRLLYRLSLKEGGLREGDWYLEDGQFKQAG